MEALVNLIPIAFNVLKGLNEAQRFLTELAQARERARREIAPIAKQTFGKEIDIDIALLKMKGGAKIAILIDLPGNVEEPLVALARAAGINIPAYIVNEGGENGKVRGT